MKAQLRAEFESALAKNSASWGIELGPDKNGFRASNSRFLPLRLMLSRPLTPPPHGTWYAYITHTESHRYAGAGAGANLHEVRKAGHRRDADLVVGTWVLISGVPRAHLRHREALVGAFVVVAEWRQSYRKQAVLQGRSSGRYTARGTHLHRRCDFGWARQRERAYLL